ncbi:molybdate ABC transporter substrate-binding protein [Virgibacillus chiguensis]|uniref:Molybdate transport system substrate-binding protein n=1 Tax=Virgibacillus chiguensis TaxID=411959 RepID=A0A1M5VE50_9BACI|nr:molybdate ABC transporter substrate-binding protein [Virgibacillus chiguensis]SHH73496.1 molybdate transport system substrate-binding protein [Virgibacillus chiguensis]
MKHIFILCISIVFLTGCSLFEEEQLFEQPAEQNKILVAADSSLKDVLPELITKFEKEHPTIAVEVNFASSGQLAGNIQQGAPIDLLLSANKEWTDTLKKEGLILNGSQKRFAHNQLVLISHTDKELSIEDLSDLKRAPFKELVLGDTVNVTAGDYAQKAFQSNEVNIWDTIKNKTVYVKDVADIMEKVKEDAQTLGVVYASNALQNEDINVIYEIDEHLHPPIVYETGITSYSTNHHDAKVLTDFISSKKATETFAAYGFGE